MRDKTAKHGMGVRTYMVIWGGCVFVALLIVTAGWLVGRRKMSQMQEQILTDAKALDAGRLTELAILGEWREDLLWRTTGHEGHRNQRDAEMHSVRELVPRLQDYATSADEHAIVGDIEDNLRRLEEFRSRENKTDLGMKADIADDLLMVVDRYQVQNKHQMSETVKAGRRLHRTMTRWLVALLLVGGLILGTGTLGIVRRVIRPTLALTRVAEQVGRGNFEVSAVTARDDELGRLTRTFNNMVQDIAKREESRLQFVASVAHDLRNPIAGIGMAARRLKRGELAEADAQKWLDMIVNNARRLETMAKDLTDNVQVASGNMEMRCEKVEIDALMRQLAEDCGVLYENHEIVFRGDRHCFIQGDPNRLERVAFNLISNAVKYSPEGTVVRVRVMCEESNAVFTVGDQGPGIAPQDMDVIFQPFGRGKDVRGVATGAGLGLFVVKQIVEAHGGRIEVKSEPGGGTVVKVALPLLND